jgi:hypothetical protein
VSAVQGAGMVLSSQPFLQRAEREGQAARAFTACI